MDWATVGTVAGIAAGVGGGAWKLGAVWMKQAIASAEKAAAERATQKEVVELRASHAIFMGRMQSAETEHLMLKSEVEVLKARIEERERERRDTRGIPIRTE